MMRKKCAAAIGLAIGLVGISPAPASLKPHHHTRAAQARHEPYRKHPAAAQVGLNGVPIDRSGRVQRGKASYYGPEFNGRRMADGKRFNPRSHAAASRTLPLGTTARVTNLRNGRSTRVQVEDRGPQVPSRITDVTPKAADDLGMRRQGVAPVEVAPLRVPQPDGSERLGRGSQPGEDAALR